MPRKPKTKDLDAGKILVEQMTMLRGRTDDRREKHRRDVEYIKANHPEIAEWLTEMTKEFGRCEYRVTLRGDDRHEIPVRRECKETK